MIEFITLIVFFRQATDVPENFWTHFGILAVPTLMIFGFWFDWRKGREQDRVRREEEDQARREEEDKRHLDNTNRLTALETAVRPISDWFHRMMVGRRNT